MTEHGSGLWGLITIIGPIVLALALVWAIAHNRRSRAEKERSERAVRQQHEEQRRREGVG